MSTSTSTPTAPVPAPATPGAGTSPGRRLLFGGGIIVMAALFAFGAWTAVGFATLHRVDQHQGFAFTGARLVVSASDGAIHVTAGQAGRVELDTHLHYSQLSPAKPSVRMDGDRLILKDGCRHVMNVFCVTSYDLRVPAQLALHVTTSDGAVTVSGISGDLDLHTADGGITADGASGRLQLRTSDGAVIARDLHSTTVAATTSDGRVLLSFLVDPDTVNAHTSDGSLRITVPRDDTAYQVVAATSDGSRTVDVNTNATSPRTISARTSDGPVSVVRAAAS